MFFFEKKMAIYEFTPAELHEALTANRVILVDVREPEEHAAARIKTAINHPLSKFDPTGLPPGAVVLHCGVGKRSAMAAHLCAKAGVKIAGHLAGGLSAWNAAGLPVISS
ncbi:rhodanese-like domain-containing protein [Acidocella sp.]|uniref:rhodanese-like domain-containing protein n=1 Tax=Acidocella sp. TaxID=50710 RepID=UPI00261B28E5|nr:rhodanese-like domain-containing protein [Acidocella sp.]